MNTYVRKNLMFLWLGAVGALAFSVFCLPAVAALVAERDYTVLTPPQPENSPGKIEVIEFFSYGCAYCNGFHPFVDKWSAALPKDVAFKRVPVTFNRPAWITLARAFYTLESLGYLQRFDSALFDAIHIQRLALSDERSIASWAMKQGLDAKKFMATFDSPEIQAKLAQAETMTRRYQIDNLVTVVVAGKYKAVGGTFEQVLANTDGLIAKVRAERKNKR